MLALATVTIVSWSLVLSDIGPNTSKVLLAAIGAVAGVTNTIILYRDRTERRAHQRRQVEAIRAGGLVAMVPEQVVKDVANGPPAPAPPEPPA